MKTNLVIPETPAKPDAQGTLAATDGSEVPTPRTDKLCEGMCFDASDVADAAKIRDHAKQPNISSTK